ncbi:MULTISPECIES: hypothetical protein [unclassified Burkholderia]|uniref:hypothetical protein n=1 Tax=unclassified Burkholderia TaxID=2613784 RepID=UPI000F5FE3E1|nr:MULTISPECIES: hypothetical protein [unclassified Burkholderia]
MNKIAIVGHPASGYREVEALLHQCGMAEPRPSRREGMLPTDITATLCKAYKVPSLDTATTEEDINQIEAGSVWHGMALDLVLGNLEQSLWGWADPKTIFALDYWLSLDPQLGFVFVYDEPHRALIEAAEAAAKNQPVDGKLPITPITEQLLSNVLNNWAAVNGALLRFYLRHPERCLLVHAGQTTRTADRYVQQLQPLLDESLVLPSDQIGKASPERLTQFTAPPVVARTLTAAGVEAAIAHQVLDVKSAEFYLVDAVLADHPSALQLYAELQSASNIPLEVPTDRNNDALAAWTALTRQRAFLTMLFQRVQHEYERIEVDLAQTRTEAQRLSQQALALTDAHTKRDVEVRAESDLLLRQLHQIQRELESYHSENQSIKSENQKLSNENTNLKREILNTQDEYQRVENEFTRTRTEAQRLLQQTLALTDSHTKRDVESQAASDLLLQHLRQVQEELERHYLENKNIKDENHKLSRENANLSREILSVRAEYERVENELNQTRTETQRLSQQTLALTDTHIKRDAEARAENDLLLHQLQQVQEELERYHSEHQSIKNENQKLSDNNADLKHEITTIRNDYERVANEVTETQTETQRILQQAEGLTEAHVKLNADLREENDLLLSQLNQIQEELEQHYITNKRITSENQALKYEIELIKNMLPPPTPPGPSGAGDRVRRQLNYRLGNVVVQRSATLGGWLGMPAAISREMRAFRDEQLVNPSSKLPPLREYVDAEEAQRVKQHLSYYVGVALVKYGRSPLGWPLLPFALLRARREFLRQGKEEQ